MNDKDLCSKFKLNKPGCVEKTADKIFASFPNIEKNYGTKGMEHTVEDIQFNFDYLQSAVCLNYKSLFLDYIEWQKMFFHSINLPDAFTTVTLEHMIDAVKETFPPEDADRVNEIIKYTLEKYPSLSNEQSTFLQHENKLNVLAQQYLNTILRRDKGAAEKLITDSIKNGTSVKDIYLKVFQPVQWEIGRLWQHNKITVAMEHYCTATTQFIMSRLYDYIFEHDRIGKSIVVTSVAGELHEIGIRMVSDFLEMSGWDTYYLGSNTPNSGVIEMIKDTSSTALAISSTIPYNVPKVKELITDVRNNLTKEELKIIVGGKPFNDNKDLWKSVNADAFAFDAESAVNKINQLEGLN